MTDKQAKSYDRDDQDIKRAAGLFFQLGPGMAACIVGGFLAGRFLDRILGSAPWLTLILAFVGAGASLKLIFDSTKKLR
ncbi:MAG: AtpZ/AtpI family protein [Clostridiales bacterium]|nr:AtpZ/AtpI family protein [Clostridiales bacterium]